MTFNPADQQEIASAISSQCCTLFVGAGLSKGAGLPDWRQLTNMLQADLGHSGQHDFLTLAQAYEGERGRDALRRRVCELTSTENKRPTAVHNLLPDLAIKTWVTTNYDNLLEITLANVGQPRSVIVNDQDLAGYGSEKPRIVKFHGDSDRPGSVLITMNDLFSVQKTKPLVWEHLQLELAQNSFLFLGYSMTDPDFMGLRAQLLSMVQKDKLRQSYAVMPEADAITRAALKACKVSLVDLPSNEGSYTNALTAFLKPIVTLVQQTPRLSPEPHGRREAVKLVPGHVRDRLRNQGYPLLCCIEYRTYAAMFDQSQFITVPQGWEPYLPIEYRKPEYQCIKYERSDENKDNIFRAWAIGRKKG